MGSIRTLWRANELFLPRPSKIGDKLYNLFFKFEVIEQGTIYWHFLQHWHRCQLAFVME